ncbi:hypothetical protein EVAR_573_1 [Eumeta japonica]|uniref:Uncharacterized protein n=1 Tax=Eumeta variegata TaxID=151549 RepID=A0A4C1SDZ8_EUMVA|nr:hypothetical protein EVAR_573_1 [Eumeta japonica]
MLAEIAGRGCLNNETLGTSKPPSTHPDIKHPILRGEKLYTVVINNVCIKHQATAGAGAGIIAAEKSNRKVLRRGRNRSDGESFCELSREYRHCVMTTRSNDLERRRKHVTRMDIGNFQKDTKIVTRSKVGITKEVDAENEARIDTGIGA